MDSDYCVISFFFFLIYAQLLECEPMANKQTRNVPYFSIYKACYTPWHIIGPQLICLIHGCQSQLCVIFGGGRVLHFPVLCAHVNELLL